MCTRNILLGKKGAVSQTWLQLSRKVTISWCHVDLILQQLYSEFWWEATYSPYLVPTDFHQLWKLKRAALPHDQKTSRIHGDFSRHSGDNLLHKRVLENSSTDRQVSESSQLCLCVKKYLWLRLTPGYKSIILLSSLRAIEVDKKCSSHFILLISNDV